MNNFFRISTIALSLGSFLAIASPNVFAQTPQNPLGGQALEISPPALNLTADPGQAIEAKILLRDVSTTSLIVRGEVNDFVASGEDGTPKLLIEAGEKSPYSLKDWISPLPELTLKPRQVENLPVTIRVPANAAPGGYYAVVRFTATPPELKDTGVSLSASIGALILLRVNGEAKESASIEQFSLSKDGTTGTLFDAAPVDFVVRVKNDGTVHQQPTGQISVKDMFGNKVANVNVNLARTNVLPGSIRRFQEPLGNEVLGNRWLFGRYTADLVMSYGTNQTKLNSQLSFWIVPYKLLGLVVLILVLLFFIIRLAIRRYNDYILGQTRGRRRR